ncbi:tagatose-bisphosphate aldolase [Streptococcus sp. NLN64]|uniref:tagatose-bisphosphate aldolase n=1 Tax=Streptococcus sp. NLN64 TaxID=2822799 RepID=UPI0018CB467E|nr:tagatose-bisphosphate aldolase [Streptococcus sp. NLN64]MBG9368221.1 tagatose-bisphosphate aldolase [Streptococcus sp. NLN64]
MELEKLTTETGLISALAFDQRGALKKMLAQHQETESTAEQMEILKRLVSEELTPYASSILLDPEFGLPAAQVRAESAGLLLAYEKTGYDTNSSSRLPDCLEEWSVLRLKEAEADAVKFLLYYDVDGNSQVNQQKQAYVERLGSECRAEGLPFFLEIVSYDEQLADTTGLDYARIKPHKVNQAMEVFSDSRFGVTVLKVEVPVNMNFVEGFAQGEIAYSRAEAAEYFRQQEAATHLPYIYLSAGVSAQLFQETLIFAAEAGARFNGVLCGRATWAGVVPVYVQQGEEAARDWLRTVGRENLESLNRVLAKTATPV